MSGPLYGYLLDRTGDEWRRSVRKDTDLGALLAARANVVVPPPRSDEWGGRELAAAEDLLEQKREKQRSEWKAALVDGPVLVIDLSTVTSGSFDPRKVHAYGPGQIVYTSRSLVAPWGKLTIEDGAMLEDRTRAIATVSLATKSWTLHLEPGWALAAAERPGDQRVVRRPQ